jgi:hypothetical protein
MLQLMCMLKLIISIRKMAGFSCAKPAELVAGDALAWVELGCGLAWVKVPTNHPENEIGWFAEGAGLGCRVIKQEFEQGFLGVQAILGFIPNNGAGIVH